MILKAQYEFVQSSRKVLLDYCGTIAPAHFIAENSTFGRGSVRNMLVHNINTYQWWIETHALQRAVDFTAYDSVNDIGATRAHFDAVDAFMEDFFLEYETRPFEPVMAALGEKKFLSTPLELFTHAVTHEYHHKGQILSLGRHLGYVPVDTDIIR